MLVLKVIWSFGNFKVSSIILEVFKSVFLSFYRFPGYFCHFVDSRAF